MIIIMSKLWSHWLVSCIVDLFHNLN